MKGINNETLDTAPNAIRKFTDGQGETTTLDPTSLLQFGLDLNLILHQE